MVRITADGAPWRRRASRPLASAGAEREPPRRGGEARAVCSRSRANRWTALDSAGQSHDLVHLIVFKDFWTGQTARTVFPYCSTYTRAPFGVILHPIHFSFKILYIGAVRAVRSVRKSLISMRCTKSKDCPALSGAVRSLPQDAMRQQGDHQELEEARQSLTGTGHRIIDAGVDARPTGLVNIAD